MKFAHELKEALSREGKSPIVATVPRPSADHRSPWLDYPPHWVESAIPYGQLKKVLKRVARELMDLGLDPETLRQLLNLDPDTSSPLAVKYGLKAAGGLLRPKLTVVVHLQNGVAVDASLSPGSRTLLERVARLQASTPGQVPSTHLLDVAPPKDLDGIPTAEVGDTLPKEVAAPVSGQSSDDPLYEMIEVPLVFDGEFFDMLQQEVNGLDALQVQEEKAMLGEIAALGRDVSHLTKPSRFSKNDLARWRAIFELYLEAQIFFSTYEQDHGTRNSRTAARQLQWFQEEVTKRNLAQQFKMAQSKAALVRFLDLNALLLKNVQFQEINRTAVQKILKKFDKRTSLSVAKSFPLQVRSDKLLAGTMARDICAQVSSELVSQVPQLNDYLCPVCFAIAYRPVRLSCQHVFCIRCIVKIQRRREKHCPLCRADVVLDATADNLDTELDRYMRKYFRKEVDEKARANDIERGVEDYGPGYKHQECILM